MTDAENTLSFEGHLKWPSEHEVYQSATLANHIAVQATPGPDGGGTDAILVTFGFAAPPVLAGEVNEQRAQVESLLDADGRVAVPIHPLARVAMSVAQARVLQAAIAETLGRVEALEARRG